MAWADACVGAATGTSRSRSATTRSAGTRCESWASDGVETSGGRGAACFTDGDGLRAAPDFLAGDARAKDVVGPPLVEEDERGEDERDDTHHGERVVSGGGVRDREAVAEVRIRDHDPRIEAREQRRHGAQYAERCHREREPAP